MAVIAKNTLAIYTDKAYYVKIRIIKLRRKLRF